VHALSAPWLKNQRQSQKRQISFFDSQCKLTDETSFQRPEWKTLDYTRISRSPDSRQYIRNGLSEFAGGRRRSVQMATALSAASSPR